jgi:hypothetical protein
VTLGSGYTKNVASSGQNSDAYFGDVRWAPASWRGLSSIFHARYEEQLFDLGASQSKVLADANLGYQLGRVRLSVQYQFTYDRALSSSSSHLLFTQLSRPFSL